MHATAHTISLPVQLSQIRTEPTRHAVQSVGPGSINDKDESAYWTDRYRLRTRQAAAGAVFQSAEPQPDMPAFLEACKDGILTTGVQSAEASSCLHAYQSRQTFCRLTCG